MIEIKKIKTATALKVTALFALFSVVAMTTQCKKSFSGDSYSPSLPAVIKSISANGGGALYCSISGGCALTLTGDNFSLTSVPYVGPYKCLNVVISADLKQIDCKVGPASNGVYKLEVRNSDSQPSVLDSTLASSANDFMYASFLYLGSQESPGKVYGYAQHPTSGALVSIVGSPFSIAANNSTYGVAISPNNKFIYAANVTSGTVSIYSINPVTGTLVAVGSPVNSGGGNPNGLFFHPSGNFLYVTNQTGNSVSAFSVASDGTLTAIAGSPFATTGASNINGLVVSNDGKFLYAAGMGGNGGVTGFTIDTTTGALSIIAGSPFINTIGGGTTAPGDGISIHPNSKWLYMGLTGLKKTSVWSINQTTGVLTAVEAPILNNSTTGYVDNGGSASTVSADGLFLYGTAFSTTATDAKKIIVYAIDQATGGLSRSSEATTGGGPNDIRLDTTGNFAYTCNSMNPASISAFSVNKTTGALTALNPANYAIPTVSGGPGIMVMQK